MIINLTTEQLLSDSPAGAGSHGAACRCWADALLLQQGRWCLGSLHSTGAITHHALAFAVP